MRKSVVVGAIVAALTTCGIVPAHAQEAPPIPVNLSDIGKDYAGNKVAAESKWDGKRIQFTGKVLNISDGWSPSVSFNLPPSMLSQIVCYVADEQQLNRPGLTEGGKATVVGTLEGDQTLGVIALRDCTVL